MQGFEENEISKNAFGGTEISKRTIAKYVPESLAESCQIIASRVRDLNEEKIRVYWHHDLPEDPEVNHLKDESSRNRFHKFVFVSNWQLNDFVTKLGIPMDNRSIVIENPIEPMPYTPKNFDDKINLIYFSTPQRGLQILIPVVKELAKKYPNIHLDVFSSFKIYGWEDADKNFEPLYEEIRQHPNMTYHGFAHQEVIREHLQKAHILAYPNIWKETSCRVLMESMSAGLMCIHPNLAALPDTSGGLTSMYQFDNDMNKHASLFLNYLEHAINVVDTDDVQKYLRFVKAYADNRFNIERIASQWNNLLLDLNTNFPTVESRKIPSKRFIYRTT
jgi:UDP-glucose:(glucosyl)LPS alpha-1,2-glucosyltransferase